MVVQLPLAGGDMGDWGTEVTFVDSTREGDTEVAGTEVCDTGVAAVAGTRECDTEVGSVKGDYGSVYAQ